MKIARAEVSYENPFSQKLEKSVGTSYARFSSDPAKVAKSTNIGVVREYQLNLNALAQEKAIELSDKGKKDAAVKELKQSAARLKQVGSLYNDRQLLEEADDLEARAEKIEDQGMTKKSRKSLRTDSFQKKNQQLSQ
jgi:Ca-activated chloride channel family protein